MLKTEGKYWIVRLRKTLIAIGLAKVLCISVAIALLSIPISSYFFTNWILIFFVLFGIAFISLIGYKPFWKITNKDVAKYLDERFPQLEESAMLLLKPQQNLSLLERFQVEKTSKVFPIPSSLKEPLKKLWASVAFLLLAIGILFLIPKLNHKNKLSPVVESYSQVVKDKIPAEIKSVNLQISPPKYTGKPTGDQKQFSLKVEVGAKVNWNITMTIPIKSLRLIFNDKEIVKMVNAELNWTLSKTIIQSGFYQIEFDGKKSDLYQIEVIPDLPVKIKILQPKPQTTIDIGQLPSVNLSVLLTDDYGISSAYISATMASGKGEGVSFTEKKLAFNQSFNNNKSAKLNKLLDLNTLGMKPGDELYFYIQVQDNHGQASRSDVYLVSIADPAELMSMAGMANGVDLVPEYFRSQRQIIIDTEKLIKEKATLPLSEFNTRSNELGLDQKLLRLRYGKFLGEEAETEIGGDHDHEEGDKAHETKFGDVKAIMDEYAHKHDIAEDATFFEPEMKMQLKAVLNEMWSSELRLRTFKLQDALPFEYKALRLLKDLQQKSRAYVAKTTIKTTRLKQEKRLTGELDKITSPTQKAMFDKVNNATEDLKILLAVLDRRKEGKPFKYGDRELLRNGEGQLIAAASSQPSSYLSALKSLRNISSANKGDLNDIDIVQKAIQKLLGAEVSQPQPKNVGPDANLFRGYFNYLKKLGN